MIVMKFGGTSVGDAARIQDVAALIRATDAPAVVVVSAVGGVTDLLVEAATRAAARDGAGAQRCVRDVARRHAALVDALPLGPAHGALAAEVRHLTTELRNFVQSVTILGEVTPRTLDYISGIGERLSCRLVAATVNAQGGRAVAVEATEIVITDDHFGGAFPLMEPTRARAQARLRPLVASGVVPIVTGFIGATEQGFTTTLGRGGSDYSAAILGSALDAEEIVIWTDVDGVMTANPRVVPEARTLPRISYLEAAELSYFGAKVLHPKTIAPAVERGIPVRIRNTFRPDAPGTTIGPNGVGGQGPVRAITAIGALMLLTVQGKGMIGLPGVAARVFRTVGEAHINVLMISQSSSEYNICLVIEARSGASAIAALQRAFAAEIAQGLIEGVVGQDGVAIVAVIGAGMRGSPGVAGRVFTLLGREEVEVLAIAQGSSELNLSFVLPEAAADHVVRCLHREFDLGAARCPAEAPHG